MEGKEVEFSNTMTLLSLSSSHEAGARLVREKRLYEASVSGNVGSLNKLMKEDGLTLSRVSLTCFDETPLHIASMQGHVEFARALLSYKQDLVSDLDSLGQSPLHKASANGYIEIVKMLLNVDSNACLVHDGNGWTPLHLAAMKGRVEVVKELVQARPEVTQLRTGREETVLHLCVMHNRFEALRVLLDLSKDEDFVNAKGDGGNSVLHIATALKQVETIKYLLKKTPVKVNAVNENDASPLDIIEHMPRDSKDMEICELLEKSGGLRFKNLPALARSTNYHACNTTQIENEISPTTATEERPNLSLRLWSQLKSKFKWDLNKKNEDTEWLKKKSDALMIVATVIASMAYQAGLNPPGGVWDEDIRSDPNNQNSDILYYAGTSIMAANYDEAYSAFCTANALSFVASLSVMFLFVSGLPLEKRIVKWILMASMWVAITSMALTHILSLQAIVPPPRNEGVAFVVRILMFVWLALIGIVYLRHACHLVSKVYKRYRKNKNTNETTQGRV